MTVLIRFKDGSDLFFDEAVDVKVIPGEEICIDYWIPVNYVVSTSVKQEHIDRIAFDQIESIRIGGWNV